MKELNKVTIIAEAGVNHNGNIKIAFDLIDAAVEAGADILVAGSFVFRSENPKKTIAELKQF